MGKKEDVAAPTTKQPAEDVKEEYFESVEDTGIKTGGTIKVTSSIKRLDAMWIEAELGEVMELEEDDDTVQLRWLNYDECWIPIKACIPSNGAEPTLPKYIHL